MQNRYLGIVLCVALGGVSAEAAPRAELVLQTGHTQPIYAVALSRDGRFALTGGRDRTAILWDVASGAMLRTFQGHSDTVTAVALSGDGSKALTGSDDKSLVLWDARTGEKLRTIQVASVHNIPYEEGSGVLSAALSHDGKRILSVAKARYPQFKVILWDAETGKYLRMFPTGPILKESDVRSAAFSGNGQWIATSFNGTFGGDDRVVVWDHESLERSLDLKIPQGDGTWVALNDDGGRLVTGTTRRTAVVWDTRTRKPLHTLPSGEMDYRGGGISADGKRVLLVTRDETNLWDADAGKKLFALKSSQQHPAYAPVALSGDGGVILTVSGDNAAALWDGRTGAKLHTLGGKIASRYLLALGGTGGFAVVAVQGGDTATVWNLRTGVKVRDFRLEESELVAAAVSADGRRVALGTKANRVLLYDVKSGEQIDSYRPTAGEYGIPPLFGTALNHDGSRVLTVANANRAGQIVLWDAEPPKNRRACHAGENARVALHKDLLLLTTEDGKQITAQSADGRANRTFGTHAEPVTAVGVAADGKQAVSASKDRSVVLWDIATGKELGRFTGLTDECDAVALSPDNQLVCAASRDGLVRLWQASTGQLRATLQWLPAERDWLVVTPEGLFDGPATARERVKFRLPKAGVVVAAERFAQDFFQPRLLASIWAGVPLELRPGLTLGYKKPPLVRLIQSPEANLQQPLVSLEVEVTDQGGGMQAPWLLHNGVRRTSDEPPGKQAAGVKQRFNVQLLEGENVLEFWSACQDGSWNSEPARVVLRYEKPLDRPRLFLLSVGVGRYRQEAMRVPFADADADKIHATLTERGKLYYSEVIEEKLTNEQATRANVREAFAKFAKLARPQDTIVVFAAGHGTLVNDRYYFLPHEFQLRPDSTLADDVRQFGVPADELSELFAKVAALRRVLVLDTCNSGGALKLFSTRGSRPGELQREAESLRRNAGVFALAGAPAGEEAKNPESLRHGVLTYALLAGLGAVTEGPLKDQRVKLVGAEPVADVLTWFQFAAYHVPKLMEQEYGRIHEVQMSAQGRSFPLLPLKLPEK